MLQSKKAQLIQQTFAYFSVSSDILPIAINNCRSRQFNVVIMCDEIGVAI